MAKAENKKAEKKRPSGYEDPVKIDGEFLDVFKVVRENKEQKMKPNAPQTYRIEANGFYNDAAVYKISDHEYQCMFTMPHPQRQNAHEGDFINSYGVKGFHVEISVAGVLTFTPLGPVRNHDLHLDNETMLDFWHQIEKQIGDH
ncbi:MAG: hypothetical protein JSS82_20490 [Bacteroidetes bacterium]|nr:hypothetical protein [Bacteroidota bacterium]